VVFPRRDIGRDDLMPQPRITNYHSNMLIAFPVGVEVRAISIIGVFYGGKDYEATPRKPSDELGSSRP